MEFPKAAFLERYDLQHGGQLLGKDAAPEFARQQWLSGGHEGR